MEALLAAIPLPFLILVGYILLISIITFAVFGTDKGFAVAGASRTRERTLLILTFIGGTPGALLAMNVFRHKTRKPEFLSKFVGVVVLQVAIVAFLAYLLLRNNQHPLLVVDIGS